MSSNYEGQDPLDIALQAEKEMNSRDRRMGQTTLDKGQWI